jgi:regulatory protein
MIVTDIAPQKGKNRLSVFLDNNYWFSFSSKSLIDAKLHKGMKLKKSDAKEIVCREIADRLYSKSVKKISRRPHTIFEIKSYCGRILIKSLNKWLEDSVISLSRPQIKQIKQKVINRLKDNELLDDKQFANWWVKSRKKHKPRSKYMIKGELMQKGVDKSVLNSICIDREEEFQMAQQLFEKKFNNNLMKVNGELESDDQEGTGISVAQEDVIKYLKNKKFGWDIIKKVLKENQID